MDTQSEQYSPPPSAEWSASSSLYDVGGLDPLSFTGGPPATLTRLSPSSRASRDRCVLTRGRDNIDEDADFLPLLAYPREGQLAFLDKVEVLFYLYNPSARDCFARRAAPHVEYLWEKHGSHDLQVFKNTVHWTTADGTHVSLLNAFSTVRRFQMKALFNGFLLTKQVLEESGLYEEAEKDRKLTKRNFFNPMVCAISPEWAASICFSVVEIKIQQLALEFLQLLKRAFPERAFTPGQVRVRFKSVEVSYCEWNEDPHAEVIRLHPGWGAATGVVRGGGFNELYRARGAGLQPEKIYGVGSVVKREVGLKGKEASKIRYEGVCPDLTWMRRDLLAATAERFAAMAATERLSDEPLALTVTNNLVDLLVRLPRGPEPSIRFILGQLFEHGKVVRRDDADSRVLAAMAKNGLGQWEPKAKAWLPSESLLRAIAFFKTAIAPAANA